MKAIMSIIIFVILYTVPIKLSAQADVLSSKEQKKLEKQKRQAEKEEKRIQKQAVVDFMIKSRRFVLEADYIDNNKGPRIPVNKMTNFIKVDSTSAVLQLGYSSTMGHNGVGGVTAEGDIQKFNIDTTNKKNYTNYSINMTVATSIGIYDVIMFISGSGYATANVSGISYGKLNYTGDVVPLSKSGVYQGSGY